MGPVPARDAAGFKHYGGHLLHRRVHHDAGLRRRLAEVSLASPRDIDCDNGGADVRLFNGVLVRDLAGRLGASLLLGVCGRTLENDEYRQPPKLQSEIA